MSILYVYKGYVTTLTHVKFM